MSEQLKNTLSFVNLAPEASVVLPHGLNTGATGPRPLAPDIIFIPNPDLAVTVSDEFSVTLTNQGSTVLSGSILVEAWHTIERAFGGVQNVDLPNKPYVVVSAEAGNPAQPPFNPMNVTIYARTTGDDTSGNGTLAKPYRTLQRAVRDVPTNIPPGVLYFVDITGITEVLPAGYILPAWKAPQTIIIDNSGIFRITMAVNIQAIPEQVPLSPPSDAVIAIGAATQTQDPVTRLVTLTLTGPARASWTNANIKGKQISDASGNPVNGAVIADVLTNNTLLLSTATPLTLPARIEQPSATLTSVDPTVGGVIQALNCDSITFSGLRILDGGGATGLVVDGPGNACAQQSELQDPAFANLASEGTRFIRNWCYGAPFFASIATFFNQTFFDATSGAFFGVTPAGQTPFLRRSIWDGCDPIDMQLVFGDAVESGAILNMVIENSLIRNGTGDGVRFHGASGLLRRVDIYGCAGNGVTADQGSGHLQLTNVRTTGPANGGEGVVVNDGMFVQVDAATSAAAVGGNKPLTGASGSGMVVGSGAFRTWANFLSGADGRPVQNEYDITSAAATGATGTGSRLYQ